MQEQTQETFGHKWEMLPITEEKWKEYSWAEDRIHRNGWTRETFEDWLNGKVVLDAGCGMGWYTEFLSDLNQDGEVYGIDIAEKAIKSARKQYDRNFIHGSITELPFADETFDYIACEEVIHHTPDPEETLEHIVEKLKPSGTFTMYVYKKKPLLREMADTTIRESTTEMSIEECLEFSRKMSELGKEFSVIDETIEVPDIPLLDIEAGTYDLHEFIYRHIVHCYFDWTNQDMDWSIANNFDWYRPEYAYRYDETELREMVDSADLSLQHFQELMSGYSVRATKE